MPGPIRRWGISPRSGLLPLLVLVGLCSAAFAAYTEPRLALTRAYVHRSATGTVSLRLQGTFSFADIVQLATPVNVFVTQGSFSARCDQGGNVFTSSGGGPEQPASGVGLISIQPNEMVVVLPTGFTTGNALVRVVMTYDGNDISTNELGVVL